MALLKPSVKRKLEKRDILGAAFDLFAREGETGFSIRKLGAEIGVDPMTVLHHFRSKDELLRAIADHAVQRVEVPVATSSWQNDLRAVAIPTARWHIAIRASSRSISAITPLAPPTT